MQQEIPEPGETVVCKISKILDYGVFVELPEYENIQGFVHISQVASSWIKNIRNFVKENQIRAGKVTHISREKGQIDISFAKVSAGEQRNKLEQYQQLKKPQRLLEILAKDTNTDFNTVWKEIAEPLTDNYDSLYKGFQEIRILGEDAAKGVPKKWLAKLIPLIEKNIEIPEKTVRGVIAAHIAMPNGAELVKNALITARDEGKKSKAVTVEFFYTGAGKYAVNVISHDYKTAEAAMKKIVDTANTQVSAAKGEIKYERLEN